MAAESVILLSAVAVSAQVSLLSIPHVYGLEEVLMPKVRSFELMFWFILKALVDEQIVCAALVVLLHDMTAKRARIGIKLGAQPSLILQAPLPNPSRVEQHHAAEPQLQLASARDCTHRYRHTYHAIDTLTHFCRFTPFPYMLLRSQPLAAGAHISRASGRSPAKSQHVPPSR